MCGFVGTANSQDCSWLKKALVNIAHRGPDDDTWFHCEKPVYHVGFRRLSIVDLEYGSQPMSNEDETIWVVCNGEIFNSPQLRKKLSANGHNFKTNNSDVETLVHLYEDYGEDCVHHLNGMYAFVIFDQRKKILFGARDRLGIKPLYYCINNNVFNFASELKSLIVAPEFTSEIDFQSLYHYLSFQFVPAPDSIFRGIKKLAAGSSFTYNFTASIIHVKKYWELTISPDRKKDSHEWELIVKEKMAESVRNWTLADVPIGCSLSGGIDSAALVGYLRQAGIENLRTFTVGFSGSGMDAYNELDIARKTAQHFNTFHEEYIVDSDMLPDELEAMVWHLDEPYGGGLPSWYIYKMMLGKVKVCMTGSGGDELFGSYGKYLIYEKKMYYHVLKPIINAIRNNNWRDVRDAIRYPHGYFGWKYIPDSIKKSILFKNETNKKLLPTESIFESFWRSYKNNEPRDIIPLIDFAYQLPEEFLFMTDRFSMAHGIEARVPFLDHELVELVYTIPSEIRTGRNDPKEFMKHMLSDMVPIDVLSAPKRGFRLPLKEWIRGCFRPLVSDMLCPDALRKQGIFSDKLYGTLVKPHLDGKIERTEWIWTLLMFQLWYAKFINK